MTYPKSDISKISVSETITISIKIRLNNCIGISIRKGAIVFKVDKLFVKFKI
jgi:hypothetical protein